MFSKIYLAVLTVAVLAMAFFTYYSWSWLQSIGQPAAAVAGFEYHSNLALTVLWLSTAVLLVLGNAVLWVNHSAWAIWATFLYFMILVVTRYFWIDRVFLDFVQRNTGTDTSVSGGPFVAAILIILAGIIAFFDHFIVVKLRAKTYGKPEEQVANALDAPTE